MGSAIVNHATAVIVLGASKFKKTPALDRAGFRLSMEDFVSYVLDKGLLSLPNTNLLNLFDSQLPPGDQLEAVCNFLSSRQAASGTKDVILYYVGHGGFVGGANQEYFLAIGTTKEGMEGSTAIRSGDLSSALRDHASRPRKYLIIDSCFAASLVAQFQGSSLSDIVSAQLLEALPESGTAALCSSGSRQVSLSPADQSHTMFSGALMDVLRHGEPSAQSAFSLDDVGRRVKDLLRERHPGNWIRPEVHCPDMRKGNVAEIPIFPNPQFAPRLEAFLSVRFESRMDDYLEIALQAVSDTLDIEDRKLNEVSRIAMHLLREKQTLGRPSVSRHGLPPKPAAADNDYVHHLELLLATRTQQWKTALSELENSYDITLETLGDALDLKDVENEGHSRRVTAYTIALARKMGLPKEEINVIARGAFLHDIGKMAIPDEILYKPGKLTNEEMNIMREHCYRGYKMISRIPFLAEAAEIVYAHQERHDGLGYPRGLKGDEIPLGARIFSIADTLDAMTADRTRHPALTVEAARKEIELWAGRQFDPKIVDLFLEMPDNIWEDLRKDMGAQPNRP
jgi:putative nucleotidyltransferase with HDIG domain